MLCKCEGLRLISEHTLKTSTLTYVCNSLPWGVVVVMVVVMVVDVDSWSLLAI